MKLLWWLNSIDRVRIYRIRFCFAGIVHCHHVRQINDNQSGRDFRLGTDRTVRSKWLVETQLKSCRCKVVNDPSSLQSHLFRTFRSFLFLDKNDERCISIVETWVVYDFVRLVFNVSTIKAKQLGTKQYHSRWDISRWYPCQTRVQPTVEAWFIYYASLFVFYFVQIQQDVTIGSPPYSTSLIDTVYILYGRESVL